MPDTLIVWLLPPLLMEHEQLTGTIIGCAMKVHTTLGPGFLESVYHNALTHELRKRGVLVELKKRVVVRYDGVVVGDYEADMLVEGPSERSTE